MSEGDGVPPRPPERPRPPPGSSTGVEVFKAILDFIGKCFYPAIIVAVIILLRPALSQVDLKGLLSRLQSAKAGAYELTFQQAQDVGAATAPLNNKIAELKREVASLGTELHALQRKTGGGTAAAAARTPASAPAEAAAAVRPTDSFERNSRYTVLVFNSPKARATAGKITDALVNAGYQSSQTETDFAELGSSYSPGTVYVTHDAAADAVYQQIAKLITPLVGAGAELKVQKNPADLRRGDVQILVF